MKDSWQPFDIGPRSLEEVRSLLEQCQGIIWIGPTRYMFSSQCTNGASKLVEMLDELSQRHCNVTVVGKMACNAVMKDSVSVMSYHMIANAAVVWEFLKDRKLPGVMALDRAYPFEINWSTAYRDPVQQLVVDIGSGNGLFLLGMAKRRKDLNFLGLEINQKLVRCCLDTAHQSGIWNGYFIATNATSTFHSIVSSYPGELTLVSIQCPNPDFNNPEHRWRMLQKSLVEAVADLLAPGGQVFVQSDVEDVVWRIEKLFLKYGKGKLTQGVWVEENPFGVRSDWEQHVIDRRDPMYHLLLSKSSSLNDFRMAGV
uniref:Phosphoglycerate kinaseisoform X4 n=2 Tax=Rhizophora mucronata TaxID=61149 RepID=A0A2P2J493_RHIMU